MNNKIQLSRREFLQFVGVAALAPLVLPGSVLGRDGGTAPGERIAIGMIGVGDQGNHHTGILLGMPDAQIVAVCDPVRAKRETAKRRVDDTYTEMRGRTFQGCAAFSDFREMLQRSDMDAVFVASPEHWHALHGNAALCAVRFKGEDMLVTADGKEVTRVKRIVTMCGLSAMWSVTSYCANAAEAIEVINVNCGGMHGSLKAP
jgi:hypothetical protein